MSTATDENRSNSDLARVALMTPTEIPTINLDF
jgi:hypothetical protein